MSTQREFCTPTLTELELSHARYKVKDLDSALLESIQEHNPDAIKDYDQSYLLNMIRTIRSSHEGRIGTSRQEEGSPRGMRTSGRIVAYFCHLGQSLEIQQARAFPNLNTTYTGIGLVEPTIAYNTLAKLIGPYAPALIKLHQQAMEKINTTE